MYQPAFVQALIGYDDNTSVVLSTGARFIRKLPDGRPLGYLHKLFAPLLAPDLGELYVTLGRDLPSEFEAFLSWANGATLFDNLLFLYGAGGNFSRERELEDQSALSIIEANEFLDQDRWEAGWTRVGSVVGWNSKYLIELHREGECTVLGEGGGLKSYPSFNTCLQQIVTRLSLCFSCDGPIDQSYSELEAALGSLIYTS
jgi:hypothetical protein